MGIVSNPVKLNELCNKFNIKNYAETGVGRGDSLRKMFSLGCIERFYGIEVDERLYNSYAQMFSNYPVDFFYGYSHEVMSDLVKKLNDSPTLFWLKKSLAQPRPGLGAAGRGRRPPGGGGGEAMGPVTCSPDWTLAQPNPTLNR